LREGIKVELMGQGHNSGTGSSRWISPVSLSCGPWQPPCSWPPSFWPSRFWAVGAAISETLFEGRLRKAQTEQARAAYDATVATYRQTVLTGFQEVEDNLAALRILGQEAAVLLIKALGGGWSASDLPNNDALVNRP
jgi:outer membrane protein TolC